MYEEAKAVLRYQPMAFVPYRVNGTNKLIVQGKITSGVENGKLPIKETIIESQEFLSILGEYDKILNIATDKDIKEVEKIIISNYKEMVLNNET